ncbi:MAG: beta-galactosidase, partial [Armatimonadetes bacterium]|nr:beta-galactosidase [Armatimonadota bacterium]
RRRFSRCCKQLQFTGSAVALASARHDERHSFQDPAPNEVCLARFRASLKEQYGDLERLNATWETTHKAWEEVRPLLTAEFRPERNNLAPWLDFRLFVSKLTMDVDARQAESLRRRTSPDLFIGIEGVFGLGGHIVPYSGVDYAEHARRCFNMIMPYDNEVNSVTNLARSFCPGPLSTWDGYSAPRWQYEAKPWWGALHGYWGMSWFCSKTLATSTGCLFPQAFWVEEATRKLRQGVGKLLMTSEMQTDPVVFLYSQPSLYAAYVAGHWINPQNKHLMNRPSTQWGRENLQRLVNEFGLQYSYVSDRQVEAGALRGKKLLILPDVMCMSQKTAEAIEEFVRGGGVVLADLCPALWDEHGRPLRPGRLDRLFGVTRDRFEYGTRPTDYLIGTTQSEPDFPVANEWFIGEYYERGLKVDGGKALGAHIFDETEVPAFVLNRTGLGAALLMNFLETNYSRYPEGRQRVFMRALLGLAKIEPPVRVLNEHGAELYQYDVTRFEDGGHLYVGVYRLTTSSPLNPEEVTLRLPRPGHLYEVKSGNDLGEGRDARVKLRAADSALVAVLPYRVEGVKARAASARAGEPVVVSAAVQASTGRPGRHILHLQVEGPDGRLRRAYAGNVEARGGRWEGIVPTALNDPKGRWKVRVREVVSGLETEVAFRLK